MNQDITNYARNRYSAKAYDPNKTISKENIIKIKELLRFSPSSVNSQPWHFVLASTSEGKERIAKSTDRLYQFNKDSILNASHVVVFCSKLEIDETYLAEILAKEETDDRFANDSGALKSRVRGGRSMFVNMHKHDLKDIQHWVDKQVYLNIGQFLLGVSTLGIDATPMEGIDVAVLDEEFGLREKGYTSLVVVPLGYHAEEDFNAKLPKSRLSFSEILTEV